MTASSLPAKSYFSVQNLFSGLSGLRLGLGLGLGLGLRLGLGWGLGLGLGLELGSGLWLVEWSLGASSFRSLFPQKWPPNI